mmetsp:Transcript_10569/g.25614  ORF Transcript_10569/g.25614 Transcript_10569/m.25614 type:complete len:125 (+) Transcript_10569:126-500(+)
MKTRTDCCGRHHDCSWDRFCRESEACCGDDAFTHREAPMACASTSLTLKARSGPWCSGHKLFAVALHVADVREVDMGVWKQHLESPPPRKSRRDCFPGATHWALCSENGTYQGLVGMEMASTAS